LATCRREAAAELEEPGSLHATIVGEKDAGKPDQLEPEPFLSSGGDAMHAEKLQKIDAQTLFLGHGQAQQDWQYVGTL